jgi:hypothetical protein
MTIKETHMECKNKDCEAFGVTLHIENPDDLPVICGGCGEAIYLPKRKKKDAA